MRIIRIFSIAMIGVALSAGIVAPAHAVHKQSVKVRYYNGFEKTRWETVTVTFATADEMSRAGSTVPYGFFSYAIVPYANGNSEIVKIETRLYCSSEFTRNCMPTLGKMQGVDRLGRGWEICSGVVCPR